MSIALFFFFSYHMYLVYTGFTTNESIKYGYLVSDYKEYIKKREKILEKMIDDAANKKSGKKGKEDGKGGKKGKKGKKEKGGKGRKKGEGSEVEGVGGDGKFDGMSEQDRNKYAKLKEEIIYFQDCLEVLKNHNYKIGFFKNLKEILRA